MKVKGKITRVFPPKEVSHKLATNHIQQFVVTELEVLPGHTNPGSILFTVFGNDKIEAFHLQQDEMVVLELSFYVSEYNGRMYNNIYCDGVERLG